MHIRHCLAAAAIGVAVVTAAAATPAFAVAPDAAAGANTINYKTTGSTTLTNPDSAVTVKFLPTTLAVALRNPDANGNNLSASLPLAPVQAQFKAYGFLPAKGTVAFTQVKPVVGNVDLSSEPYRVTATAFYVVTLRDVTIGGAAANVGTNCQTIRPVKVAVTDGGDYDLFKGTLNGVYDLGQFQNCGPASNIINDTLPGTGNTLTLHINLDEGTSRAEARAAVAAAKG